MQVFSVERKVKLRGFGRTEDRLELQTPVREPFTVKTTALPVVIYEDAPKLLSDNLGIVF